MKGNNQKNRVAFHQKICCFGKFQRKSRCKKTGKCTYLCEVFRQKAVLQRNRKWFIADTKAGGRLNPLSAYKEHTINYYDDGKKIGTFKIKLNSFLSGQKASEKILSNPENLKPTNSQEYIYFQFNVKYVTGTEVVDLKDVFSYYYNIFDSTGTKQLENIDWGFFFELMEDLSDVTLSPGQSSKCSKAILVSKGNTPVLYRIRTGRTSYTWFTTKK